MVGGALEIEAHGSVSIKITQYLAQVKKFFDSAAVLVVAGRIQCPELAIPGRWPTGDR
jgi:hypothetical protein